ncbi:hypothetical protein DSO57_1031886 [Entomophthora muscae]|uniref:Uncharacterized protein n=1 Tax=Entomophthora muscae TaxID=34485 RepID=A0ACC2SD58_9FUNG|nr:hypothetical protein DSO57_1031886 [Entomophthora muscae]
MALARTDAAPEPTFHPPSPGCEPSEVESFRGRNLGGELFSWGDCSKSPASPSSDLGRDFGMGRTSKLGSRGLILECEELGVGGMSTGFAFGRGGSLSRRWSNSDSIRM